MKNDLTIVIPCKNEKDVIIKSLDLLNHQDGIDGVDVIISDNSDDIVTKQTLLIEKKKYRFNVKVIDGGLPSVARNNGAKLVKTDYVLFLDADIFILDKTLINDCLTKITNSNLDLVTVKFNTSNGKYNRIYNIFHKIQKITKKISPFALGGFMMMNIYTFNRVGGFNEVKVIAEDYDLTRKIKSSKFRILDHIVFTTPRRFENKGIWYMLKIMIGSFIFRNSKTYFNTDKNYWL